MKNTNHTYWESRWSQVSTDSINEAIRSDHRDQDEIIEFLKAQGVHRICDAGCGFGTYNLLLAVNGFEVEGFDLSESAVAVTKELLGRYKIDASRYRTADIQETEYEDEQFDAAIAYSVLDHMTAANAEKGMEELFRIIKPGGLLLLAFDSLEEDDLLPEHTVLPDGSLLYTQGRKTNMIFHPFTEQELSELFKNKEIIYRKVSIKNERIFILKIGK